MTADTTDNRDDAAAIEREVRRTQDEIGDTVQSLEDKLNPRDMTRSVMGDDGADAAKEALEVTRQNPIPVAMIAVGLIWLLATARTPGIRRFTDRLTGRRPSAGEDRSGLRPRSAEPAPIGPPPPIGETYDRRLERDGFY